jgi:hypothetical protein
MTKTRPPTSLNAINAYGVYGTLKECIRGAEPMTLPIPFINRHTYDTVQDGTEVSFTLFESLVAKLETATTRELKFSNEAILEFPQLVASYLTSSFQRVRVISWGVISSINGSNEPLFVLSIRSILESAANLAYLRENIIKTYSGEMSRNDMTYLSLRMKFATRKPDDWKLSNDEAARVSSINILTTIRALDRFACANLDFLNEKPMTTWYERLCEFAHPNCLGNSVGSEMKFVCMSEKYDIDPNIRPGVLAEFGNYAFVSLYAFCLIYNKCWRMLLDHHEVLPTREPSSDPFISLI